MPERRATASGGGKKPGEEAEKTSLLVSNSLCIGDREGAAGAFWRRRRIFLDEARPLSETAVGESSSLALGSATLLPPT